MKKVIIVHGWGGDSECNWFPWLKKKLEKKGITVIVPDFPNTNTPQQNEWLAVLNSLEIDEETYLIGHSLGNIAILKYLQKLYNPKHKERKVAGVILVAGFAHSIGVTQIESFFIESLNFTIVKKKCKKFIAINSDDDHYVDLSYGKEFRDKLGAELVVLHNYGHIKHFELPILLEKLEEMFENTVI